MDLAHPSANISKRLYMLQRKRKSNKEDRMVAILAVLAGGGRAIGARSSAGVTNVNIYEFIFFLL